MRKNVEKASQFQKEVQEKISENENGNAWHVFPE